jgi:BCD family chlorophyll transporter-like MFS transporter
MKKVLGGINIVRLGGFSLGYGLVIALMSATLNRVMLADLEMSPMLVGFLFAIPMLVSPVRMWFGYRSDGFKIFGLRREPYILGGVLLTALSAAVIVIMVINAEASPTLIPLALILIFALYGIGRNLSNNIFQALISDNFSDEARRRAITLFEVVTLFGTVMGAGMIGRMLEEYDPARLVNVTLMVMVAMVVLAFIAIIKQERPSNEQVIEQAQAMPFRKVVSDIVLKDRQIRLFFLIIMFTIVGTQAQDAFLEPYGGLVLDMSVGETTRLTQQWGMGVLVAMLASGIFLIKWLGYIRLLRIGLIASALVFVGVILAGALDNFIPFSMLVLFMGLSTGMAAAGMLAGLITFTTPARAGLLLGVWGVANALGRAIGSLMGGGVVETLLGVTGDAFIAYAGVFVMEVVMLIGAFVLTMRFQPIEEDDALVADAAGDFDMAAAMGGD